MAFTKQQREALANALPAYARAQAWGPAETAAYLVDLVTRSRNRQKADLAAWLAADVAEQQARLASVDAQALTTKTELQARIDSATIDVATVAD